MSYRIAIKGLEDTSMIWNSHKGPRGPLVYASELWVFAMCPALRGSTVSYAGDTHCPKHSLEYSLNIWSQ